MVPYLVLVFVGIVWYGSLGYHNTYIQTYTIGGVIACYVAVMLLRDVPCCAWVSFQRSFMPRFWRRSFALYRIVVAVNVERYFKKLLIISAKLAMPTRKKLMVSSLFTSMLKSE